MAAKEPQDDAPEYLYEVQIPKQDNKWHSVENEWVNDMQEAVEIAVEELVYDDPVQNLTVYVREIEDRKNVKKFNVWGRVEVEYDATEVPITRKKKRRKK